jgi:eukaryotic-like serine/threonine-protein kinase
MTKFSTNSKSDIFVHIAIILSIILVSFFAFFFVYLPWSTNHGQAISVPTLKGLSLDAAENLLDDSDLSYEISDSLFMPGAAPYTIIANYPKSGSNVKSGRKIYLTVAAYSAPLVKMPNIVGRSTSSAKNQLLSSGLVLGDIELTPALEENTILKIKIGDKEIKPGDEIAKGSKITLIVGDGYGNQKIDVPNVVGMLYDEADILLSGLGLTTGSITYAPSDKPAGTVFKQSPSPGDDSKIKIGAGVNIWVSGDATTPTLIDDTIEPDDPNN